MDNVKQVTIVDFETEGIGERPAYPPVPVGVSIQRPGMARPKYMAWGHPAGNNCTKEQAVRELRPAWRGEAMCFQNAKFDLDVAEKHLGLSMPPWERVHDTMYLIFLHDPHARTYSLKPSAERILNIKPEERDELRDWIVANVPEAKRKKSEWGAYICKAPATLVGKYANGDVYRTRRLLTHLHKEICARGMQQAYDRERRLMPILLRNEQEGVRANLKTLEYDLAVYSVALESADMWLRKTLHAPDLNIDSDADFAEVLSREGIVDDDKWVLTKKRKRSVSKKNLTVDLFNNARVAAVYSYRNRLSTCIGTFLENWLRMASACSGRVHNNWNQVRSDREGGGGDTSGARTGRMSCNKTGFMNAPKNWKKAVAEGYVYPSFLKMCRAAMDVRKGQSVPDLPRLRRHFLPDDERSLWGRRDYNQQELRITAHYEDGDLMHHYQEDERFDHHQQVQDLLKEAGHELSRDPTKILNFQDIYGGGDSALAAALHITVKEAHDIKAAKRALLPDFAALEQGVKQTGKAGLPIRTWGGREYYVEPPAYSDKFKRVMSFEYKLLNYLVQGSAADCTKEALCRWNELPESKRQARFLITVHDEVNISAHAKVFKQAMSTLRTVMQSIEFDVKMLSDAEYGKTWGTLEPLKEPR